MGKIAGQPNCSATMGPFLFVWAGPTILIFAVFMAVYKKSGLVTRITASLHPHFGAWDSPVGTSFAW